jgi:hypothetical protein
MGERSGLSKSTIRANLAPVDLKPHLGDGFKLSNGPLFVQKVVDVVGLYHNPPEKAVMLSGREKRQAGPGRVQPVLPMMPRMAERRSHDYARHGVTSLFAAFDITDGPVISELHRQHPAVEFKKSLQASTKPCRPRSTCTWV